MALPRGMRRGREVVEELPRRRPRRPGEGTWYAEMWIMGLVWIALLVLGAIIVWGLEHAP